MARRFRQASILDVHEETNPEKAAAYIAELSNGEIVYDYEGASTNIVDMLCEAVTELAIRTKKDDVPAEAVVAWLVGRITKVGTEILGISAESIVKRTREYTAMVQEEKEKPLQD